MIIQQHNSAWPIANSSSCSMPRANKAQFSHPSSSTTMFPQYLHEQDETRSSSSRQEGHQYPFGIQVSSHSPVVVWPAMRPELCENCGVDPPICWCNGCDRLLCDECWFWCATVYTHGTGCWGWFCHLCRDPWNHDCDIVRSYGHVDDENQLVPAGGGDIAVWPRQWVAPYAPPPATSVPPILSRLCSVSCTGIADTEAIFTQWPQ